MSAPEFFNPDTVSAPLGAYSHGGWVKTGSELLYISGQVGFRPDGSLPETFAEQCTEVMANLVRVLQSQGLTPANIVKINQYIVTGQSLRDFRDARSAALGDARPTSTFVYVPQLADPRYLVEVEAIAAR